MPVRRPPMQKQYDMEDFTLALEHVQMLRSAPMPQGFAGSTLLEKFLGNAPAWIVLMLMVAGSYVVLNTRLTTVEYQNSISITDRGVLHSKIDEAIHDMSEVKSNFSAMKADLTDIKESVHDLVSKRR